MMAVKALLSICLLMGDGFSAPIGNMLLLISRPFLMVRRFRPHFYNYNLSKAAV